MLRHRFHFISACRLAPLVICAAGLNAQSCLVLSPPTIQADGTASLSLSLYTVRGLVPAAVQWIFELPPSSSISYLNISDGPALTSAGKTTICPQNGATYNCMAVGANQGTIGNGIIAQLTAVLLPGAAAAAVLIRDALAVSADGYLIPIPSIILSGNDNLSSSCGILPPPRRPVAQKQER
jgi:hypothetical protein